MPVQLKKGRAIESISLTSLIDVVFLLLIFFLVATRFAEEDRELPVQLPNASEAQPLVSKPREFFINIDDHGQYFVGREAVTTEKLREALTVAAVSNPLSQSVVVRADKNCNWEHVVTAINLCRQAGINDVRPVTQLESN